MLPKGDVKRSIYTVMRGFEASTQGKKPDISNEYENSADLRFTAKDGTLVKDMHIIQNSNNNINASGICRLSEYEDPYSGYIVDGELSYDCEQSSSSYVNCEFSCNTKLTGSKVKTLEFELEINSDNYISVASVYANGKKVKFNQWGFITNIIRAFDPKSNF